MRRKTRYKFQKEKKTKHCMVKQKPERLGLVKLRISSWKMVLRDALMSMSSTQMKIRVRDFS